MKSVTRSLVLMLIIPLIAAANNTRVRDPIGCYLATPPFHPPVAIEASLDTARAIIAIDFGGGLRRPHMPREARVLGAWTVRGDSLHAWFSDGFTGWSYRLGPTSTGWQGFAEYSTDERNPDERARPVRRPAVWTRRACS